ncbi:hypothetical protein AB9F36_11680 [Rhizobium leguminosarum]|uniref:hypothetical protein n=1 Tax=Rhizobium leguminosarum TaxID=384 RepID=UPI003F9D535E
MKKVRILDTSAIMAGKWYIADDADVVIPAQIVVEIRTAFAEPISRSAVRVLEILRVKGARTIGEVDNANVGWVYRTVFGRRMRRQEGRKAILAYISSDELRNVETIEVVSTDYRLGEAISTLARNVQVLSPYREEFDPSRPEIEYKILLQEVVQVRFLQAGKHLLINAVVAAVAIFAFYQMGRYLELLSQWLYPWGIMVALPAIGIGVFAWRQWYRLSYGLFEFMVGVAAAFQVMATQATDIRNLTALHYMQIVAGIYVVVRGLDNIGKGLEPTKYWPLWRYLFRG